MSKKILERMLNPVDLTIGVGAALGYMFQSEGNVDFQGWYRGDKRVHGPWWNPAGDDAAALAAIREFCRAGKRGFEIGESYLYRPYCCIYDPTVLVGYGEDESLGVAICRAIVRAAKKDQA